MTKTAAILGKGFLEETIWETVFPHQAALFLAKVDRDAPKDRETGNKFVIVEKIL